MKWSALMKKIYLLINTILLVAITVLVVSCKTRDQVVILYYSDPQAMYLIPVSTTIKTSADLENVSKAKHIIPLFEELMVSRDEKNLHSCIPKGIKFKDIEIKPENKEIDLTLDTEKQRLGDTDEQMMVGAIVNTLTELNGFTTVKINPGNLQTDMDYSEPITRESWRNLWYLEDELNEKNTLAFVYWLSKDRKYFVPLTIPIPKNDVTTLLKVLKNGPQGSRKTYLERSINPALDIIIKASNMNHIDIELKSKQDLAKSVYEEAKTAVLLTISELNVFETVKFISPFISEEIIDLKKFNPKKEINRVEFFAK